MRVLALILIFAGQVLQAEPPRNPNLASDWAMGHGSSAQAAFSARPGPAGQGAARIAPYAESVRGVSPWLVETGRGALYGASLTHLFRYRTQPDVGFEAGFPLTRVGSISWNLLALAGRGGSDLIIVPQPLGLRAPQHRGSACAGRDPALLVFEDREGPLQCLRQIRFDRARLAPLCQARGALGYTAAGVAALWDGTLAVTAVFRQGGQPVTYLVNADARTGRLLSCLRVGPGRTTNNFPVEPLGNGRSALYMATGTHLVRIDHGAGQMRRRWSVPLGLAERTGTTPTLVGGLREGVVALVEGKCAVTNVFSGRIGCSERSGSRLLWVKRATPEAGLSEIALPAFIRTIENSPATDGRHLVIADYGGYRANARAGGVVAMRWTGAGFEQLWAQPGVQFNGVPTISGATGLLYSSGLGSDGQIVARGLALRGANAGQSGYAARVGPPRRFLDAGGNTVILPGRRLVYSVGEGLVVLR